MLDGVRADVSQQQTAIQQMRSELAGKASIVHVKEALQFKAEQSDVDELRTTKVRS